MKSMISIIFIRQTDKRVEQGEAVKCMGRNCLNDFCFPHLKAEYKLPVYLQPCSDGRPITTFASRQGDLDLPEEFRGLAKVNIESEADVEGLEAPPTVVSKTALQVCSVYEITSCKKKKKKKL